MNKHVLDKVINKKPWLCRLGFHRYRAFVAFYSVGRLFVRYRCARCMAEMTRVQE